MVDGDNEGGAPETAVTLEQLEASKPVLYGARLRGERLHFHNADGSEVVISLRALSIAELRSVGDMRDSGLKLLLLLRAGITDATGLRDGAGKPVAFAAGTSLLAGLESTGAAEAFVRQLIPEIQQICEAEIYEISIPSEAERARVPFTRESNPNA